MDDEYNDAVPRRSTLALGFMQKSSTLVATSASLAFLVAGVATSALPVLLGWRHEGQSSILIPAAAAAVLAGIVWVGGYIGARVSLPGQRTGRLITLCAAVYALVGAVMEFPVKTHAVLATIDGPFPGRTAQNILAALSYACFAAVLFSPLVVKGLASMRVSRTPGGA
jgi:hypothetical protein